MKNYTSIEQAKKLAEFLPIESADMYYFLDPTPAGNIYHIVIPQIDFGVKTKEPEYNEGDIPCWSLTALLNILPDYVLHSPNPLSDQYCCMCVKYGIETYGDTQLDAVFDMIIWLNKAEKYKQNFLF